MEVVTRAIFERAILEAREEKSFWQKYKWLIIGGAIAMPIQVVAGYFYLRYRKNKKAALKRQEEETRLRPYSNMGGH